MTSRNGSFRTEPQRAGEYFVVALGPKEDLPYDSTPRDLERLAAIAERVTLLDGEERQIDLRVVSRLP